MSTPVERLAAALRTCASSFAAGDQVAPSALLWPDPEQLWEGVIPELQSTLPELFVLGSYAPDKRTGPALWLLPRRIVLRATVAAPPSVHAGIVTVERDTVKTAALRQSKSTGRCLGAGG